MRLVLRDNFGQNLLDTVMEYQMSAAKIVLLGDSHMNHFRHYLLKKSPRLEQAFRLNEHQQVNIFGYSGGRLANTFMMNLFHTKVRILRPNYLILWLGGNDLDCVGDLTAEEVAQHLMATASLFQGRYNLQHVYILQLMQRSCTRSVNTTLYNEKVKCVNEIVQEGTRSLQGVSYWKLRHFATLRQDLLKSDGVHLNDHGMKYIFHNVRGAIIRCS